MLRILHQDEHLVAIHKPPGLLVHRTGISEDRVFAMTLLRDQLGRHVFPVHRLDRGTAGVLVFALSSQMAAALTASFTSREVQKEYIAIVRGHTAEAGTIDHPLAKEDVGGLQPAITHYTRLATAEIPMPVDRYATARYSLLRITPETGRMHQIRRHFAHIRHPLLGDRKRGDRHHNRAWEENHQMRQMMLLASRVTLPHPVTREPLQVTTDYEPEMLRVCGILGWKELATSPLQNF